jgi:uncharacterized protein (TIGR02466 family)
MHKKNVFEIPVWHVNISNNVNLEEIEKYCLSLENQSGRVISNEGGFQSNNLDLKNTPQLNDLFNAIEIESNKYSDSIKIKHCEMGNSWVNINYYLNSNQSHRHANARLSGVFYASTKFNEKCGNIMFRHPCTDYMAYNWDGIQTDEFNPANSLSWTFEPHPCDLIIFPAWLEHRVEPNFAKDYKRISISFNMS